MVDTYTWYGNVQQAQSALCEWITSQGGWAALTTANVLYVIDTRLGIQQPGWTATTTQVLGVIDYRLGLLNSGNTNTGCAFA